MLLSQVHHSFINEGEYWVKTNDILRSFAFVSHGSFEVREGGEVATFVGNAPVSLLLSEQTTIFNCEAFKKYFKIRTLFVLRIA